MSEKMNQSELVSDFFGDQWGYRCPCGTSGDGFDSESAASDALAKHEENKHDGIL
jgi:hypothetical protein